jgi:hypothetical protein
MRAGIPHCIGTCYLNDWIILEYDRQSDIFIYHRDHWSPLKPEGKKKYDHDLLLELQDDPLSKKKPENSPDIDVVLKHSRNHVSLRSLHCEVWL